jgi:hypothetical protein
MKSKDFAKKRLMFIQKEDYNYLCYNLILLLDTLECIDESQRFRDFRKAAYLIDFISSSKDFGDYSKDELINIYSKAQLKKKLLSHLLIVLKNRDYLGISINSAHKSFDIWLIKKNIPSEFFNQEYFVNEINNLNKLKRSIRSLKTTTIKTMVDSFFTSKNILTWEI